MSPRNRLFTRRESLASVAVAPFALAMTPAPCTSAKHRLHSGG